MSNMSNNPSGNRQTIPFLRWSADCYECEDRWFFDYDDERDKWIERHRRSTRHRVLAGTAIERRPAQTSKPEPTPEITHEQAIVNVANILGIARVVADEAV